MTVRPAITTSKDVGMKVELVIHTTCGVEFELLEADTGKVIDERGFVCDEGDEDAEDRAVARVRRWCERNGHDLVIAWS